MNWKRAIAKEWLYILSFAAGSLLLGFLVLVIFEPDTVSDPGPEPIFVPVYPPEDQNSALSKEDAIAELKRRGILDSFSQAEPQLFEDLTLESNSDKYSLTLQEYALDLPPSQWSQDKRTYLRGRQTSSSAPLLILFLS